MSAARRQHASRQRAGAVVARSLPGLFACLLFACLLVAGNAHSAAVLDGEWRTPGSEAAWQPFEPARLTRIPRQPAGAELRLWARDPAAFDASRPMLVVRKPGLERLRWRRDDGTEVGAALLQTTRSGWLGHGRIGFELDRVPTLDQPLRLFVEPQAGITGTLAFALQERDGFLADDARWLALVSTCLALLAGTALIALVFALRLRDPAFLFYAGYVLGYAMIQLIQTGYVASPLGWTLIAEQPRSWGRLAVLTSVVMAVLFLHRFASLQLYLPRGARLLLLYAAAIALNAVLGFLPFEPLQALGRTLVNPLLIIGGPLLLLASLIAWRRGSRYAGVFAIGWAPLLLITVAGSLQLYGFFPNWIGSNESALVAAAFEAIVLSAGLADRAAAARRDRDLARALADIDPLTGVLNRRALDRAFAALDTPAGGPGAPLAALFCDLDEFKRLNDTLGHATGDRALQAVAEALRGELRNGDLIGRYGGEEFVLLLPGTSSEAAQAIAERLRQRVAELGRPPQFGCDPLTISIGLAMRDGAEAVASLLLRADAALYRAKRGGRNQVVLATPTEALPSAG